MSIRRLFASAAFPCAVATLACTDSAAPPGLTKPGIHVLSGGTSRDTIGTPLLAPLEVRIVGPDGKPAAGTPVRFSPLIVPAAGPTPWPTPAVSVFPRGGYVIPGAIMPPLTDTTTGDGMAGVRVVLGTVAGRAGLVVEAPQLGLVDTVEYTVLPGAEVRSGIYPKDTAVYIGRNYALLARSFDRKDNPRDTLNVTFGTVTGPVSVTPAGAVTGNSFGRAKIVAYIRGVRPDTAHVSVVPEGTIAAHSYFDFAGDSIGVVVVNLDGTGRRRVAVETPPRTYSAELPPQHHMAPRWDPSGSRIVYQESQARRGGNTQGFELFRIYTVVPGDAPRPVFEKPTFYTEENPEFTRDGWIIFSGKRAQGDFYRLWRVRPDGSGLDSLGGSFADNATDRWPTASRDGQWLAYWSSGWYETGHIRVRNLATGTDAMAIRPGAAPRWSPSGEWMAYIADAGWPGPLRVVRRDGSGDRLVVSKGSFERGVDWSPDERYLIAATAWSGDLEVIEVATGARVPLPFGRRLSQPSWKRASQP